MKNALIGMIGGLLVIYVSVLSLGIYGRNTRQNEIENCLSQVLENAVETWYVPKLELYGNSAVPEAEVRSQIESDIRKRLTADSEVDIQFLACDMEKGLLSVQVVEQFRYPGGEEGQVSAVKTVIVDQPAVEAERYTINLWISDVVYKTYQITVGERIPQPEAPRIAQWIPVDETVTFLGWKDKATDVMVDLSQGIEANGDMELTAVYQ